MTAVELQRHFDAALIPLLALASAPSIGKSRCDDNALARLPRDLQNHRIVQDASHALRDWQHRLARPPVLVHGDYCFANLLFSPDGSRVTAVIDWERARADGCRGFDALYLAAFAFGSWQRRAAIEVVAQVWGDACDPGFERLLQSIEDAFALSRDDLRHVALQIWLRHLELQLPSKNWTASRRRQFFEEPARCIAAWFAARR